jgi:hypothetical protein
MAQKWFMQAWRETKTLGCVGLRLTAHTRLQSDSSKNAVLLLGGPIEALVARFSSASAIVNVPLDVSVEILIALLSCASAIVDATW